LLINHLFREISILEITRGVSKVQSNGKIKNRTYTNYIKARAKLKNRTYTNYIIDRAGNFINGTAAAL